MSQDEKIDYALALDTYRNTENLNRPLDAQEKELIDEALKEWKQELGCTYGETLDEFLAGQYFRYAQKLGEGDWLDNQLNEAIAEYNKPLNPAQEEIYLYKEEWGKAIAAKQKEEEQQPAEESVPVEPQPKEEVKQTVEENVPVEPQQKEEAKQNVEENIFIELDGNDDVFDRLLENEEGASVVENVYINTHEKELENRKQRHEEEEKKRLAEEEAKRKAEEEDEEEYEDDEEYEDEESEEEEK
jgi:hypothetical protein